MFSLFRASRHSENESCRHTADQRVSQRRKRRLLLESLESRRCLTAVPITPAMPQLEVDPSTYDPTSFIVKYESDAPDRSSFGGVYGPSRIADQSELGFDLHHIELHPGVSVESILSNYAFREGVEYVEPNYRVSLTAVPNDPQFGNQWDMHNTGQSSGTTDADVDGPEAWDITTGTGSTIVAVIDTGVDYLHPDLIDNMWTNPGEIPGDGLDNDGNGYVDDVHGYDFYNDDGSPRDDHNHGTHVAGTIAAKGNNGIGVAGVNWNAQVMAVKFLGADGSGTTSDAIAAVRYAFENGAHISNNSWGGDPYSQALFDAIQDAQEVGHIFVAAAGNGNWLGIGQNNDASPFYPASYDLDNVVAVAATDRNDARGFFSNYGATSVDLAAPGVDILSTTINGGYGNSSGTSMAAPHVAGALSLVRDYDPSLSFAEVIDRVLLSADPVESMAGITVTGGRLNVAASLVPDETGPMVTSVEPADLALDPFSYLRVSFSETLKAGTFGLADIQSLSGPQGAIVVSSITPVAGSNGRVFDLNIPTQDEDGEYTVVIGSQIEDRFGNLMDQNQNGVGGQADDLFQHSFTKAAPVGRFDFGTSTSAVAEGYTRVVGGDSYSTQTGFGWSSGAVYSLSRGGEPLTQDFNYTTNAVFAMDVPNGEYDVIITLGESIVAHDQMGVFLEGVQVDSVTTEAGQFATQTYRTSVSDGQLTLGLQDLGGSDSWVMINAMDVVFAGPDQTGPFVNGTTATGTLTGPIDRLQITFNELIQPESFTTADVIAIVGPSGAITPTGANALPSGNYEVTFEPQNESGAYQLVIGPDILDIAGNPMDQDDDGIAGEIPEDRFVSNFTLEAGLPVVASFDFGNASSALESGYTRVTGGDTYDAIVGYGWQGGPVYTISWGGEPLTQDLNYTRDATFVVDLPNGEYDVVMTMGEAIISHDQMGVFIEGVQVDSVSTAGFEFATNTYRTSISDGQLNIGLRDLGGSNLYAVINALQLLYAGPDTNGPQVDSSDATGTVEGPIDRLRVVFNEPIQSDSFTVADVTQFTGPDGDISIAAVNEVATGEFEIVFATTNQPGEYSLRLGPEILDIAGNLMDQDGDGVAGEAFDDQFATTFDLQAGLPTIARLDFGTNTSPVEDGYARVSSSDAYDPATGFGWLDGSVYSIAWGGQTLTRDLNYTADATFAFDVPNGQYDLVITMGEAIISHDQMGVFVEGNQVDSVSTAGFQFVTHTYRANVFDGQLSVRLKDLGGSNAWAVINAMEILYVGGHPD